MHFNKVRYIVPVVLLIINCQLSIVNCAQAQVNYPQEYKNAKLLFQEGKYNLAMELFKKVIPYDPANDYSEYASFYYALAAHKQGYYTVAGDMLLQIKTLYPKWEKQEEVNYWLTLNYFAKGEHFQALKICNTLTSKKVKEDVNNTKAHHLNKITDTETLRMALEEYPRDTVIAKTLAYMLSKNIASVADKEELQDLIDQFGLNKDHYINQTYQPIYKDTYSVAVLFPFVTSSIDLTTSKKKNQFVIDLYQGFRLGLDTLQKQGIDISLRVYDTERSTEKLKSILEKEELKNTDLIIGPLLREDNPAIREFCKANKINSFNPLSSDFEMVSNSPFSFLFHPSYEILGQKAAIYLASNTHHNRKKCIVFYGNNPRDSVLAWEFIRKAEETGVRFLLKQKIPRNETHLIADTLNHATEFDEFKAPVQFTIPKDSIGAIFVASEDPVIYTKVVSSVEARKDNTLIIGSENWLENGSIDLEKFHRLNIVLYAPTYTLPTNKNYEAFIRQFIVKHGRTPNSLSINYAKIGYELALLTGNALKKYGVYFQEGFNKEFQQGFLTEGFDFRYSQYNQSVPFIKFINGSLEIVAK